MFILSSSHLRGPLSSERCVQKGVRRLSRRRYAIRSAKVALAHDLEEVHDRIFKHGRIGETLLEDATPDRRGRTLLQIIEDPQNGWGVRADTLRRVLGAHSKNQLLAEAEQRTPLKIEV